MKILTKSTVPGKRIPQMLLFCIFWYALDQIFVNCSGQTCKILDSLNIILKNCRSVNFWSLMLVVASCAKISLYFESPLTHLKQATGHYSFNEKKEINNEQKLTG